MKKFLILTFLVCCGISAGAQSVSLSDLTNLATLNLDDAHTFLTVGKPFKQSYYQIVNGLTVKHYENTDPFKKETIVVGDGYKTNNGQLLHIVNYTTKKKDNILRLIAQAKEAGLHRNFNGTDQYSNIYLYDSYMFTVRIFIKNDNSEGTVQVKENDFVDYQ